MTSAWRETEAIADHPVTPSPHHPVIVIGYGNDLRGDDAAGPRVAGLIDARALPGVRAIAVRQLTPDLAEQLARADLAVFVDAYPATAEAQERRSIITAKDAKTAKVQVFTSFPNPSRSSRSSRLENFTGALDAEATIQLHRIGPAAGHAALGHTSDPCALLALALTLYGYAPPAWLIAVPALTFDLGAPLSPTAEQGILAAVRQIGDLLTGLPGSVPAR